MAEPLAALRKILRDPNARGTDVVGAARALLQAEAQPQAALPRTVAEVQAMSTADLHALVARLELAHHLPTDPEGDG